MQDWRDGQVRYLVHFDDGGSGMRFRDEALEVGAKLRDGGDPYRVERVESRRTRERSGTPGRGGSRRREALCRGRYTRSGALPGTPGPLG
jgi:hypothetical protein